MTPEQAAALRAPFAPEQIGKLPKINCGACSKSQTRNCDRHKKAECSVCGSWITTAHIHLDYCGHAAVCDRLLAVDPGWSWEPVAFAETGEPRIVMQGGEAWLWIRLTVCGVTRLGVGTANTGSFELPKQLISDALRNAAMRYGVALDLWSKEDLGHDDLSSEAPAAVKPARGKRPSTPSTQTGDGAVAGTGDVASASPESLTMRDTLTARAKALDPELVKAARATSGLPTIGKADGFDLVKWDTLLAELELERPM